MPRLNDAVKWLRTQKKPCTSEEVAVALRVNTGTARAILDALRMEGKVRLLTYKGYDSWTTRSDRDQS